MNKNLQYNQQQTESKQSQSEVEELNIYRNLKPGKLLQHLYLKIDSGFHARKNFSEETMHIWK